jgi:hypothetical protein
VHGEIICFTDESKLMDMLHYLHQHFEISQGSKDYYVGFHVKCWREVRATFLHQTCYIKQIINCFGMVDCHLVTTSIDIHTHLVVATKKDEIVDVPYKEVVGSLIYVMTLTFLDITYVVTYVAKFVERPIAAHWTTIKHVFHYLQGIVDFGLLYYENVTNNILMGYCDSDFASDPNDHKSHTR